MPPLARAFALLALSIACASAACTTETTTAVDASDAAPDPQGDDTSPVGDAGSDAKVDAAPKPLCHSGNFDCKDGIPCCGGYACKNGSCKAPDGTTCTNFGSDCSVHDCCPGTECTAFSFGSRCTLVKTCTKEGHACADSGNCCGGLTCEGGTCKPPPRKDSCKIYGETCGQKDCCPSTPFCNDFMTCCMPADWNNTSCGADGDCCTGVCTGGLCEMSPLGGSCTFDEDCGKNPSAIRCQTTTSTCCVAKDASCSKGSDCCSGSCSPAGKCACLPKGATSSSSGNCCSLVLVGTTCQ